MKPEEGSTGVEKERIEKEATDYSESLERVMTTAQICRKFGYIAGATAERERYIAALNELIEICEEYTRIRSVKQKYSPEHKEEWERVKAAIDNAKRLVNP